MEREIGYVVVEFNQASGQPDLASPYLLRDKSEAEEEVAAYRETTRKHGRRERYAVGTVTIDEEDL